MPNSGFEKVGVFQVYLRCPMFSLPLLWSAAEPPESSRLAGQAGASTILGRVRANKRPRLALCCLFSRSGMPWRPEFCLIGISGSYRKSGACASLPEASRALAVALAQGRQPVAGRPDLPTPRLDLLGRGGAARRDRALGPRCLQGKGTDLQAHTCRAPREPQVRHAPGGIRVTRHLAPPPPALPLLGWLCLRLDLRTSSPSSKVTCSTLPSARRKTHWP